jgi:hypothetical protein
MNNINIFNTVKSLFYSTIIIGVYYLATEGIVKLLFNEKEDIKHNTQVMILFVILFILSFIFVVSIYHIVGPFKTEPYYKGFLIFSFSYLGIGNLLYLLIKRK